MALTFILSILFVLFPPQKKDVEVYHENLENGQVAIYARNNTRAPQSVKVEITLKGMESSESLPVTKKVAANDQLYITTLKPTKNAYSYHYKFTYIMGDVTAQHNDDYVYRLPFPEGKSYVVGQGYNEGPTHQDQFAVDFNMDEGSTICAIRPGKVIEVKESNNRGCPDESCTQYNNFVMVEHSDGSIADYSHIQKNGSFVKVGDQVKLGQPIAKSGSTGWASGPHLHLEVYVMRFTGQESVKARYHLGKNQIGIPQSQQTLRQELNP